MFLDEIRVSLTERAPEVFDGTNPDGDQSEHGTRIVIRGLRSAWRKSAGIKAYEDIARLQPLVPARDFETPGTWRSIRCRVLAGRRRTAVSDRLRSSSQGALRGPSRS